MENDVIIFSNEEAEVLRIMFNRKDYFFTMEEIDIFRRNLGETFLKK